MKKIILLACLVQVSFTTFSQTDTVTTSRAVEAVSISNSKGEDQAFIKSKYFKFGPGLGYSLNLDKNVNDATLSPGNNYLKLQTIQRGSFNLSGVIVYNKTFYYKKIVYNNQTKRSETVGDEYPVPSWISYVATLNIAEFTGGNIGFNKKLDGGLGVAFRISNWKKDNGKADLSRFSVGIFLELSSYRQLREYIQNEYRDKAIPTNVSAGTSGVLNALDDKDNNLFYTKVIPGLSFKFIYLLTED